jgi:hypothetical protein
LPTPAFLLARVYADQGKDKKALEELAGALQVVPTDKFALRLTAQLQWKGGERESREGDHLEGVRSRRRRRRDAQLDEGDGRRAAEAR